MIDKRLLELVRVGIEKGYSEQQLKDLFIKQGYKNEDIEEALMIVEKERRRLEKVRIQLEQWNHSLTNYKIWLFVIIIFILSFLFVTFSTGELLRRTFLTLLILAIILIYPVIMYKIYKTLCRRNKLKYFNNIRYLGFNVIILTLIFISLSSLDNDWWPFLPFSSSLVIITLHSLFLYFKNKEKYPIELLFLLSTISLTTTIAISLSYYFIYTFFILHFVNTTNIITLSFNLFILLIVFLTSFVLISNYLLGKTFLKSKASFRRFYKRRIIKYILIISFLSLVVALLVSGILAIKFTKRIYKPMDLRDFKKEFIHNYAYERHYTFLEDFLEGEFNTSNFVVHSMIIKSPYNLSLVLKFILYETKYACGTYFQEEKNIYKIYDCNKSLKCEEKGYYSIKNLNKLNKLLTTSKKMDVVSVCEENMLRNSTHLIFLFPFESEEEVLSHSPFELEDPELQKTSVVNEINNEWKDLSSLLLHERIDVPKNSYEMLLSFFSGKVFEDFLNCLPYNLFIIYKTSYIQTPIKIIPQEYKWIKKNEINGTVFYDNTRNITEHIKRLNRSVNYLFKIYINYSKELKQHLLKDLNYSYLDYSHESEDLLHEANYRLEGSLDFVQKMLDIIKKTPYYRFELLNDSITNITLVALSKANNPEVSNLEKALRLKLAEITLLKILFPHHNYYLESNYSGFCEKEKLRSSHTVSILNEYPEICNYLLCNSSNEKQME